MTSKLSYLWYAGCPPFPGPRDGPSTKPSTGYMLRQYLACGRIKIRREERDMPSEQIKRVVKNTKMKQVLLPQEVDLLEG